GHSLLFRKLLRTEYSFDMMEDPVENLYTENLIFFGGNHIVFQEIASHPVDILRHITHIIFNTPIKLPDAFKKHAFDGLSLLLFLGDLFCSKAGLTGNIDAPDSPGHLKTNPSPADFSFSETELIKIC